jgi:LPXTG-motif cell wall-anchored protein
MGTVMKIYEVLYIFGIFLIIASIATYILSSTIILNPEQNSASNLLGKTTEIDTTFASNETHSALTDMERQTNTLFLWIGVPLGILIFLSGIFLKRKKEGPDLFLDDEIEDND